MNTNDFDPLRWILRTKVDKATHDSVCEIANRESGGNISQLLRKMIDDWLEQWYVRNKQATANGNGSLEFRLLAFERERRKRRDIGAALKRLYSDLTIDPDPIGEQIAGELAVKYDLTWPPGGMRESDTDSDLQRVRNRLVSLWRNKSSGRVSLRELNRSLAVYSADELRRHVSRLESLGDVVLEGSGVAGTSLILIAPR